MISPFPLRRIASDLVGRFGIVLLGSHHAVVDLLLLLLEQILEDELTPSAAACVHQRATLVELSLEIAHCRLARAVGAHCRGARGAGARLSPPARVMNGRSPL